MAAKDQLFADFPGTSKAEWLEQVRKDLKGRPLEELTWVLEEGGIRLSPFAHTEDLPEPPSPLMEPVNDWEIGEYIIVDDIAEANRQALEGLEGGVQALGFVLKHRLDQAGLERLLQGVQLDLVSLNFGEFYTEKHPMELMQHLVRLFRDRGYDPAAIAGSVDCDPFLDWISPSMEQLAEMIRFGQDSLPGFRVLQVNGRYYHDGIEDVVNELAFTLAKGNEYLAGLRDAGISPEQANQALQFSMAVSTSYFVEIAKLRALYILWLNVLRAYGVERPVMPERVVHLSKESQTEDIHTNMIRAGTQALSAVIGGADRLYVLPANNLLDEPSTPFTRRIARNVQHLLKMESFLDRVVDPAAGSYYLEKVTALLAEKAWERFQELSMAAEPFAK